MKVWLLQIGEPLPLSDDVRCYRTAMLADQLLQHGHEVVWWASTFEHQRKVMLFSEDTDITLRDRYVLKLLKGCGYRKNVSLRRYFDHRIITGKFRRQALENQRPDIIVASMPTYDLAYEGVRYALSHQIPIIVDVRDLWPQIFIDKLPALLKPAARFFLMPDFAQLDFLLKHATALTAMSAGILEWALARARRNQRKNDRVYYMGYAIDTEEDPNDVKSAFRARLAALAGKQVFTYIGTFGLSYELPLVLDVAEKLQEDNSIHFAIAGSGEREGEIQARAASLANVTCFSWLNKGEIHALLKRSYAGLVPCNSVIHAFPNKVCEYMAASLPLVSSLTGEAADLIARKRLGFNYEAGDRTGLKQIIIALSNDPVSREEYARNAGALFQQQFRADLIYNDYACYLEELFALFEKSQ